MDILFFIAVIIWVVKGGLMKSSRFERSKTIIFIINEKTKFIKDFLVLIRNNARVNINIKNIMLAKCRVIFITVL